MALNFKNKAGYNKWLGYIYANKLNKPGGKPVKIGGKSHKVNRSEGKALGGEVTEEEPTKKDLRRNKRIIRKALRGAGVSRGSARRFARNTAKTTNPWSTKVKQAIPQKIDETDDPAMKKDLWDKNIGEKLIKSTNKKRGGLVGKLRKGGTHSEFGKRHDRLRTRAQNIEGKEVATKGAGEINWKKEDRRFRKSAKLFKKAREIRSKEYGLKKGGLDEEVTEEEPRLTRGQTKRAVKSVLRGQGVKRGPARKTARHMTRKGTAQSYLDFIKEVKAGALKGRVSPSSMRKDVIEKEFWEGRKKGGLVSKLQNGGLGIQSYDDNLKNGGLIDKIKKALQRDPTKKRIKGLNKGMAKARRKGGRKFFGQMRGLRQARKSFVRGQQGRGRGAQRGEANLNRGRGLQQYLP